MTLMETISKYKYHIIVAVVVVVAVIYYFRDKIADAMNGGNGRGY